MAEGDLTRRFDNKLSGKIGEMVNNLNKAIAGLNTLLQNIVSNANIVEESAAVMLQGSEEMKVNTGEIASSTGEMSAGAQAQVMKVDESSHLIEEILQSSQEMGNHAREINEIAKNGAVMSSKGEKVVRDMAICINEILDYAQQTNKSIKILTDRSGEIGKALSVITDISSQTNLLALNAAIEAAQAGDSGRGFAVVAEEIRKLAEDSRRSAKEIEKLVFDVQNDTNEAANIISSMNNSVNAGGQASVSASAIFKEITSSSQHTLSMSEQILKATSAQVTNINNVVNLTENIVVIAEETAAGAEEIASSTSELSSGMNSYNQKSQQLANVADTLKKGVAQFKLDDDHAKLKVTA